MAANDLSLGKSFGAFVSTRFDGSAPVLSEHSFKFADIPVHPNARVPKVLDRLDTFLSDASGTRFDSKLFDGILRFGPAFDQRGFFSQLSHNFTQFAEHHHGEWRKVKMARPGHPPMQPLEPAIQTSNSLPHHAPRCRPVTGRLGHQAIVVWMSGLLNRARGKWTLEFAAALCYTPLGERRWWCSFCFSAKQQNGPTSRRTISFIGEKSGFGGQRIGVRTGFMEWKAH